MSAAYQPRPSRLAQDRIFWLIVAGLGIAYLLTRGASVLPLAATLLSLLLAITVHECAHAWSADRLGDPTARLMGRVTLNPLAHLDPMGTVMMVITALTGFGIGWGKPVPVSPWRLRYGTRLGNGLVALAGPAANIALSALVALLLRATVAYRPAWPVLRLFEHAVILTNLAIAFFNLLPIPPLDGASVLIGVLSLSKSRWAWQVTQTLSSLAGYGPMLLIGLILLSQFAGFNLFGTLVGVPAGWLYRVLVGR